MRKQGSDVISGMGVSDVDLDAQVEFGWFCQTIPSYASRSLRDDEWRTHYSRQRKSIQYLAYRPSKNRSQDEIQNLQWIDLQGLQ